MLHLARQLDFCSVYWRTLSVGHWHVAGHKRSVMLSRPTCAIWEARLLRAWRGNRSICYQRQKLSSAISPRINFCVLLENASLDSIDASYSTIAMVQASLSWISRSTVPFPGTPKPVGTREPSMWGGH